MSTTAKTNGQAAPSGPKRMSFGNLVRGKQVEPLRVLMYSPEGVGKSTFAAGSPKPIFLAPEQGTAHLDVDRFPMPESWQDMLDAVRLLESEQHDYQTLVVDTLDHAEPLLWQHVCEADGVKFIEDVGKGYGRGYVAALDGWRVFLGAVERLRRARNMHVIFLAHSIIKTYRSPDGDDYERYQLKLNEKASGLFKEWVDCVLFANYETLTVEDKKTKRVKGISTGARLIHTQRQAAFDSKNRYNLPETLPLAWADFAAAVAAARPADPAALTAEITRRAKEGGADLERQAAEYLVAAAGDAVKLAKLCDWVTAKLNITIKQGGTR